MQIFQPTVFQRQIVAGGPNPANDAIYTTNLDFHYDISNTACYPGTGTKLTDLISNTQSNDWTNGAVTSSTAANGATIKWIGWTAGYCPTNVNYSGLSSNNGAWTVEYWIRRAALSFAPFHNFIIGNSKVGAANESQFAVAQYDGGGGLAEMLVSDSNGGSNYFFGVSLATNVWHQVVISQPASAASSTLYVDGVSTGKTTGYRNLYYNGGTLWAPGRAFDTNQFTGQLAIVRIYDAALNSTQVAQNWDAQKYRFGL